MSRTPKKLQTPEKPPILAEIEGAIIESGYLLEYRIAEILRSRGFETIRSHHFEDPDQGKSRELDIYAYKDFMIGGTSLVLTIAIPVECHNSLLAPMVILKEGVGDLCDFYIHDSHITGAPARIYKEDQNGKSANWSVPDYLEFFERSHYVKNDEIAFQWASIRWNKQLQKWWALHPNEDHDDLDKLIRFTYIKRGQEEAFYTTTKGIGLHVYMIMPVMVVGGPLYKCDLRNDPVSISESPKGTLLLRKDSETVKGEYCIDVVSEEHFEEFLDDDLHDDIGTLSSLLAENIPLIEESMEIEAKIELAAALVKTIKEKF